jgi:hypothetical protein
MSIRFKALRGRILENFPRLAAGHLLNAGEEGFDVSAVAAKVVKIFSRRALALYLKN